MVYSYYETPYRAPQAKIFRFLAKILKNLPDLGSLNKGGFIGRGGFIARITPDTELESGLQIRQTELYDLMKYKVIQLKITIQS